MIATEVVLGEARFRVPRRSLVVCGLFEKDPSLLVRPYEVRSQVSPEALQAFLEFVQFHEIEIRDEIREEVKSLSNEFDFDFSGLGVLSVTRETQRSVDDIEEILLEQDRLLASITRDLPRIRILEQSITRLKQQVLLLSSEAGRIRQEMEVVKSSLVSELEAIRKEGLSEVGRLRAEIARQNFHLINLARGYVSLLMLGSCCAGKTFMSICWSQGICLGTSSGPGVSTINRDVVVQGKPVNFVLYDTSGQECFWSIASSYLRYVDGLLLLYDIADGKSFESIPYWLGRARKDAKPRDLPLLIVAWDKKFSPAVVSGEEGKALATRENAFFAELYADQSVIDAAFVRFLEAVGTW
jgi:hypothetical protein